MSANEISQMAYALAQSKKEASFWEEMISGFIRNQKSFETQKAYLADLRQFFFWMEEHGVGGKITFNRAVEYRDYLKAFGGRTVKGVPGKAANTTVHRKISAISSFLEFVGKELMEKNGRSIYNPFKRVERFLVDSSITTTEALTGQELKRLMEYVDQLPPILINLRDRAMIKTLFGVIIRNRAFINLTGRDFYLVGERFRLRFVDKGEKVFDESLHPQTANAIIEYLEMMRDEGREVLDDDPLFQPLGRAAGKFFSVNQITNILKRHCRRAGIGDWVTSHTAKATVTSELVEMFGVHFAQRKTRHKKTEQVVAYYGKRRERELSPFDDLAYLS